MAIVTLLQAIETAVIASFLLTIGESIRRLYFHPLAHIPGPKLAALTWWYEFYFDAIQKGKYVFKIQEVHKKYGPIIRVTPDEIHINDIGFLDTVYAPPMSRRDKYEYQLRTLRVPGSVTAAAPYEVHKKRRETLTQYFSKRNVIQLEPLVAEKVKELCQLISNHARAETPINLSDALFAFANDVASNFAFAHQSDLLSDEEKSATLRQHSNELLLGININKHFPWIPDFLESLPLSISKPLMPPGLVDLLELFDRVRVELAEIVRAKSSGIASDKALGSRYKASVLDSLLDNPTLPPQERTMQRLEQEGALLVLAGTESPAKSLSVIFCHLLLNPTILSKLRVELLSVPESASWTVLEQLPYLSAVLEEGNRLSFGVTARTARIAHEPLTYTPSRYCTLTVGNGKSYSIPPRTPVSITTLSAHTAESVFPDPFKFDPERWLGSEGRERRKFQMALGKGGRKCIGIELARAELYLVTAALVTGFDMTLWETDESDVEFVHDYQVSMPNFDSKGVRIMAKTI